MRGLCMWHIGCRDNEKFGSDTLTSLIALSKATFFIIVTSFFITVAFADARRAPIVAKYIRCYTSLRWDTVWTAFRGIGIMIETFGALASVCADDISI